MEKEKGEKALVDLLSELDETAIVNALEEATEIRGKKGFGVDLIEAFKKKGIIVKVKFAEKPFYESKKFWGGVVALVIMLIDSVFPEHELWMAAMPALAYIFGQGLADLGKNRPTLS